MRLVKYPSKIIGIQLGELELCFVGPPKFKARFMLLRDPEKYPGIGAGAYDKDGDWSDKAQKALDDFVAVIEEEVLPELFDVAGDDRVRATDETSPNDEPESLSFPTLGDG